MSSATSVVDPLSAFAIQVDARDNVAVARVPVPRGTRVQAGGRIVDVRDDITPGHRFALVEVPAGDFVRQYGQPIGTSLGVEAGALISRANMSNDVPVVRGAAIKALNGAPLDPVNLYNITWRGADDSIKYEVLPKALTGVDAEIVVLYGRDFPSGAHKVGAAYSVLAEEIVFGRVDVNQHTVVWPSTGNYGIGGAWVGGAGRGVAS